MDPEERARLVREAVQEYEIRQQVGETNRLVEESLAAIQRSAESEDAKTPSLSFRLAKLKGVFPPGRSRWTSPPSEDPPPSVSPPSPLASPPARRRPRGSPRGGRGRGPRLIAPAELPDGLLSGGGGRGSPVPRRGRGRSPRTPARRSGSETRQKTAPGRGRARGRGRGRGRARTAAQLDEKEEKSPAKRGRGRARFPRVTVRNRAAAARRKPESDDVQRGSDSGGSVNSGSDGLDAASPFVDDAKFDVVMEPDIHENGDGLANGDAFNDSHEGDDPMVTVFPCVQVVQNSDASDDEADSQANSNHVILDVALSSPDGEMSPEPPPPPPPLQARSGPRTILVRRSSSSSSPAAMEVVSPGNLAPRPPPMIVRHRPTPVVVRPGQVPVERPRKIVVRRPFNVVPGPPVVSKPLVVVVNTATEEAQPDAGDGQFSDDLSGPESNADDISSGLDLEDGDMSPGLESRLSNITRLRRKLERREAALERERSLLSRDPPAEGPALLNLDLPGGGRVFLQPPSPTELYPLPPSPPPLPPPPSLADACLRPASALQAPTMLHRLQSQYVRLRAWALQAAQAHRQTQRRLEAARQQARRERHLLRSQLRGLLSDTQWTALRNGAPPGGWPVGVFNRAVRIRAECGERGYRYLQSLNMPLPELEELPPR